MQVHPNVTFIIVVWVIISLNEFGFLLLLLFLGIFCSGVQFHNFLVLLLWLLMNGLTNNRHFTIFKLFIVRILLVLLISLLCGINYGRENLIIFITLHYLQGILFLRRFQINKIIMIDFLFIIRYPQNFIISLHVWSILWIINHGWL